MTQKRLEQIKDIVNTMEVWELKSLAHTSQDASGMTFSHGAKRVYHLIDVMCSERIRVLEQTPHETPTKNTSE